MKLIDWAHDFYSLFYPATCAGCCNSLMRNEEVLCTTCLYNLPRTNFHNDPENEVAQIFWGRAKVENASSYLYFHKKGIVQAILHKLKYKGEKEVGIFMGRIYGYDLKDTMFAQADVIIPVPLHIRKFKERGYNQSEMLAKGLAVVLNKPVDITSLKRRIANPTQTRKHRYERWLNVNEVFEVKYPENLEGKHILLVDDVVTTGATLESCANVILECENTKVSIVTLAKA
jgi:ComF family protein